jgi:hypothetical protein
VHTNKIDVQLNNALLIISESVKSTPVTMVTRPVLANIPPAKLKLEAAAVCELVICRKLEKSLVRIDVGYTSTD